MFSLSTPLTTLRRCSAAMLVLTGVALTGLAAPLTFDAPLHIQPDEKSPVVGTLPHGTSVTPLLREALGAAGLEAPPPGWIAIRSSGPFAGFVRNRDVEEGGSIKAGAEIRAQPLADAPLLLVVENGDQTNAREPIGDWSRATIRTDLIVFINALPPDSRGQVAEGPPPPIPTGLTTADTTTTSGKAAKPPKVKKPKKERQIKEPKVAPVPVETAGAPRTFEGYLARTRHFLGMGPKYAYELVNENNGRIALLDVSALSNTAPIESFEGRHVSIYGPGIQRSDVKDLIIRVQTLRLLQ